MTPESEPAAPLSAIVVAGTHSGVGKTSVTLGLIGALRRRGLTVQPFKVGPDFIDPLHHSHASGRPPRNLDGWMLDPDTNRQRFARATADADAAVIEGVMGLFDGSEGKSDRGSTAEMAKLLDLPVLLVVDAGAMARSAAALIHGYTSFDPNLRVAGVILNNIGSDTHAAMIRDAVAGAVPIVGALPRQRDLVVPERHLGLHLPHEARSDYIDRLAQLIEQHLDLGALLANSCIGRPMPVTPPSTGQRRARIAIAQDEAFCFYYADNLELLEQAGAELVPFSPIRDPLPNSLDGLYLGGGYPELHARQLADNTQTREAIREFAAAGGPVYAECGGLMYLAETLELDGTGHPMCAVLPFGTKMPARLTLAYVEVTTTGGLFGPGMSARGHLFHHSELAGEPPDAGCYRISTSRGDTMREGYGNENVLASYAHLPLRQQPLPGGRARRPMREFTYRGRTDGAHSFSGRAVGGLAPLDLDGRGRVARAPHSEQRCQCGPFVPLAHAVERMHLDLTRSLPQGKTGRGPKEPEQVVAHIRIESQPHSRNSLPIGCRPRHADHSQEGRYRRRRCRLAARARCQLPRSPPARRQAAGSSAAARYSLRMSPGTNG